MRVFFYFFLFPLCFFSCTGLQIFHLRLFPLSDRQFNQRTRQARRLQTAEAGDVLPSHHRDGQRESAHEQHQHPDHPGVRLQQGRDRPVLQRGGLRPAYRPQYGSSNRHSGLHYTAVR